ncbi:MAG: SDR family oxidoreductase [Azospirillaceae bacterium]|nr:SDR family oxidoreductase [Azospirillaceae bacterium]
MSAPHSVIAGGSSGIGLATAKTLLNAGHKVSIAGRNTARLDQAARLLGDQAQAVVMDAADPESVKSAFASIGPFDHLVLAFGSTKGAGPFATVDLAEVRQGFVEKVFPHFATAQAALPFLAPRGSITFVAAVTAHSAMPGTAGIGAANAAVAALVPILAAELKPLRVNGVSPGVIDTPWWDFLSDDVKATVFADFAGKTPVGRVGQADDIAQTIAFLISNGFMSGDVIICDGGLRLGG